MKFSFVCLGDFILKYQVPLDIFNSINEIFEKKIKFLKPANAQLVGKIKKEYTLFSQNKLIENNEYFTTNELPKNILIWFNETFIHYLNFIHIKNYKINLNSIWINEMNENEYNPVHIHHGTQYTGLSSVMILKLPNTFGYEYSAEKIPHNGKLHILGTRDGMFSIDSWFPPMNLRDFYVFPYDMRHCVYPFNGTNEVRRTLAANCDVKFDPLKYRGGFEQEINVI